MPLPPNGCHYGNGCGGVTVGDDFICVGTWQITSPAYDCALRICPPGS